MSFDNSGENPPPPSDPPTPPHGPTPPYPPGTPAPPTGGQPPYQPPAPAAPGSAPPLYPPAMPPSGAQPPYPPNGTAAPNWAAPMGPPQPSRPPEKNTIGLISLIVGAVGFVLACIPATLIFAWILLPAALILGIIALCLKGKSKWMGLVGLILGIVGPIVAGIVFVVFVVGTFGQALDDAYNEASGGDTTVTEAPTDDSAEEESGEQGTRDNPVAFDSTIENDDWTVTLTDFVPNANDDVASNEFNDPPGEGEVWIEFTPTVTYQGDESGYAAEVQFAYVDADGTVIDALTQVVILDDGFDAAAELYNGASATGKVALLVPDDVDGTIRVTPGFLGDEVFVALP